MVIVNRPIGELIPYEKNAKKHEKRQVANVAESIRQYGFVQPVVIDRDGVIVIGHCRVMAAKKLGMAEVPCVSVEDLTPEQANALRIVDNKTNESPWDLSMLSEELPELDLSGFEFDFAVAPDLDDDEIEALMEKEVAFRAKEVHVVVVECKSVSETDAVSKLLAQNGYLHKVKNT